MDKEIRLQFWNAMQHLRKFNIWFCAQTSCNMGEMAVLESIRDLTGNSGEKLCVSDLYSKLFISKPGVSQLLGALEKRGYLCREIDRDDHRRVTVTLTPQGEQVLLQVKEQTDSMMDAVLTRFGDENARQLLYLLEQLSQAAQNFQDEIQ